MRIKWLHLSDIHFNYKNYESHSLREDFLKRIQSLDQSEPFTHLFITGDVLYGNAKADEETIMFVKKLMNIMGLTKQSVFIIPGNHDHDRTITQEVLKTLFDGKSAEEHSSAIDDMKGENVSDLLKSHTNFNDACSRIFEESDYSWTKPHFITNQDGVSVINVNTSWLDTDSSSDSDYLRIGTRLLQMELSENESQLNQNLNIAIGHHTLGDLIPEERKRALDQFKRRNIGIYFCGHRHKPKIEYYDKYDVLEFVAPGGYHDGYSDGGYIWGIIDTENDFYKAEVYGWYDNKWCIESKLDGTNEYGIYYFKTDRFQHHSQIAAVDCKTMGGHIPKRDLDKSLDNANFDVHIYNEPIDAGDGYTRESIQDFAQSIVRLVEKNEKVHLYPLAPIPMLLSLGFELQKDSNITIHQFNRTSQSWVLTGESWEAELEDPIIEKSNNKAVAISISTSYLIERKQIEEAMGETPYDYIGFKTDKIEPGYPLYYKDVDDIVKSIISVMNSYVNKYDEIHLFASIPAGMAVELGRRMLRTVYSNIHTYQLDQGAYIRKIVINPVTTKIIQNAGVGNCKYFNDYGEIVKLPVLGKIACGQTKDGADNEGKVFPICDSVLDSGEYFVVVADGDSMVDAGIDEGDYIIVKSQSTADDGDIVVALIEEETTLKRLYHDHKNKKIILHPENTEYKDMIYGDLCIQGVAVHVIKRLK